MHYLRERVKALGSVPQRRRKSASLTVPELSAFEPQLHGTGDREISTTMAFVRILNTIVRDKHIGARVVPIVADESRTFGMEGMFRQLGIYSSVGQLYHPQDAEQLMWYREDKLGQILQEGINEAGAISSWIAAGTSYSNHDLPMIPFYIFYSMFGFQRIGDLAWAAGDSRTRGFLLGGNVRPHDAQRRRPAARRRQQSGRGFVHSQLPELRSDLRLRGRRHHSRRFAAHAHRSGRRLLLHHAAQRELSASRDAGRRSRRNPAGNVPVARRRRAGQRRTARATLRFRSDPPRSAGSRRPSRERLERSQRRLERYEFQRAAARRRRGAPLESSASTGTAASLVRRSSRWATGPAPELPRPITSTRLPNRFARSSARRFATLGTDGYGRSDFRRKLREFFEVNRHFVVLTALKALADEGQVPPATVGKALKKYAIDPNKPNPVTV